MFKADEYYMELTLPTVGEYYADASNVRRGMLACMSVLHVIDHIFQNRNPDPKKANDEVRDECDAVSDRDTMFAVVRGFANASKHAVLTNKLNPGFGSKDYLQPQGGGLSDGMVLSGSVLDDTSGAVMVKWKDQNINLQMALSSVLKMLVQAYPELNGCPDSPP